MSETIEELQCQRDAAQEHLNKQSMLPGERWLTEAMLYLAYPGTKASPTSCEAYYANTERKHLGDPDQMTGIYSEPQRELPK